MENNTNKSQRSYTRLKRRKFYTYNMNKIIDETIVYESHKENHARYVNRIQTKEAEYLNRTIFVTNVKDLSREYNLKKLKMFFEKKYGPLESCVVETVHNQPFPGAKITFRNQRDAHKLYNKSLFEIRKRKRTKKKICTTTCGHKGFINIQPGLPDRAQIHVSSDESYVTFDAISISMGHFTYEDGASSFQDNRSKESSSLEYLEEYEGFMSSLVTLDLENRSIRIIKDTTSYGSKFSNTLSIRASEDTEEILIFRLKGVYGALKLCQDIYTGSLSLIFVAKYPPRLVEKKRSWESHREITRLTSISDELDAPFDHCFAYKLNISHSVATTLFSNKAFFQKLQDFGMIHLDDFSRIRSATNIQIKYIYFNEYKHKLESKLRSIRCENKGLTLRSIIDRGVASWYDCLNDVVEYDGNHCDIFDLVRQEHKNIDVLKALEMLKQIHRPTRFPAKLFKIILTDEFGSEAKNEEHISSIPPYCSNIPLVVLTPTRFVVQGFVIEMSNRVTRQFDYHFMRLSIADEDMSNVFPDDFSDEFCKHIKETIRSGVSINGRYYRFLAYSSSQLKEKSMWMVSCSSQDKNKIRSWMGDFNNIKLPSKYAARMGQCFSTTVQTLPGNSSENSCNNLKVCDEYPDIEVGNFCHSDGTGLIRHDRLIQALKYVPFAPTDLDDISIVQIRFGGAKGTLTSWDFDKIQGLKNNQNMDVCLRPSMVKFKAPYYNLEITGIGSHLPYYLNRQIIFLLEFHGIPPETFLNMQSEMIDDLDKMMKDPTHAINVLPSLSGPDNTLVADMIDLLHCGFSPFNDPFLFSCLHSIRNHHLMQLRKKTRIRVNNGAVLMGGLDETGLLPEGCIFVQLRPKRKVSSTIQNISKHDDEKYKPIVGPVLVAKHPVMHPGDVRMLLAIDVPELRSNKNMILFSQHGKRPEADKMSGSDLDGDQFAVCWDRRLFLKSSQNKYGSDTSVRDLDQINHKPMNFANNEKAAEVEKVEDDHLIEHFINHARNDLLGKISMLWLDYAAMRKTAGCKECLKLAVLHSIAVDFPKNGVPATIPDDLKLGRKTPRPHWREFKKLDSYQCDTVIGLLYDNVVYEIDNRNKFCGFESVSGRNVNQFGQLLSFFNENHCRELLYILRKNYRHEIIKSFGLFEESEDFGLSSDDLIDFAESEKQAYEDELIRLMNRYEIHSEGEILTGCICKFHRWNKKRQHDLAEEVKRQCRQLRRKFRDNFLRYVCKRCVNNFDTKFGDSSNEDEKLQVLEQIECVILETNLKNSCDSKRFDVQFFSDDEAVRMCLLARKLASAYYCVTYDPEYALSELRNICEGNDHTVLFSFPWVVADVLAHGMFMSRA